MDRSAIQEKIHAIKEKCLPVQDKVRALIKSAKEQLGGEESFIGIDVGSSSIKIVQIADVNGKTGIIKSTLVDIKIPGKREEVLASLKMALIGFELKGAKVHAIINCPETCTRKIVAPNMPKKELAEAIRWEAKNAIPFSIDEALMDYEILDEVTEKGVKKLVVAVSAAPKETVSRFLSLFKEAGVELAAMIPISLSLQSLLRMSEEYREANIAVVELGASIAELNIYRKRQLSFSRKLPITGGDITKAMTSTLMSGEGKIELSTDEAEAIKKEHGLPIGSEDEKVNGKIMTSQIVSLVRPCVEQLASEIERSFDFFREESHGEKVERIVLFGGGANLKGLAGYLNNDLGIPVEIGNALAHIKDHSKKEGKSDRDASCLNLAIGAILDKNHKINLLPAEEKEKTKRFVEHVSIQAVVVGVVMTLLLSYIGLKIQFGAQHKKLNALKLEQRSLIPQTDTLRSMLVAHKIQGSHPYWEDVLKEISNTMQPKMYLTNLSTDNDVVRFVGVITKGDKNPQSVLSSFIKALKNGIFKNVILVTSKKETEGEYLFKFEISAEVE